ncbi:Aste57867_18779 [Aphanomyces stellatus]|uniref:Aste57867_18779 protein n=1 Tax=Aphanomyces stellatus TaxID=120398 RepID=A0A485LCX2_9STRA|nr:hypothetical protein As57867_018715 [Aphanomyces stellatus]VFT95513.1 Aste57867_18779 [Aphanomyces stellatus]
MQVDAEVQALIESSNGVLEVISVENAAGEKITRVKCTATEHEMPPRVDVITSHINSKRFKKATEWYSYDFAQYEPYLVSHRRKPKCLFCNVTGLVLNKIPAEVEKHMQGRKFLRLKEHVKFFDEDEIDKEGEDFDANKFEFLNRQLLGSDDEGGADDDDDDDDDNAKAPRKRKANDKEEEDIDAIFYKDHSDLENDDDDDDDDDAAEDADDDDEEAEKPAANFVKKSFKKTAPPPKKTSTGKKPTTGKPATKKQKK